MLSDADPLLAPLPLWHDATGAPYPGGDEVTTILPAAQRAAYRGLGRRPGAVAAGEPATGRILALVSTPSYNPGEWPAGIRRGWGQP
ncbi:Penicillin-binding protein OS=Streptomyces fumanus OX=67302 GN=GCM10018772_50900 PE=3 SV=1 [Streptomyces fumanus]